MIRITVNQLRSSRGEGYEIGKSISFNICSKCIFIVLRRIYGLNGNPLMKSSDFDRFERGSLNFSAALDW